MNALGQEEAAKREFVAEGLVLNLISGSRYLGAYLGPQEELEAWVKPQVEVWSHGVRLLDKNIPTAPPVGLCRLWYVVANQVSVPAKYCPVVGTLMGPIEEALRETFFPALFWGEDIDADFWNILGNIVKHGGLYLPDSICQRRVFKMPPRRPAGN